HPLGRDGGGLLQRPLPARLLADSEPRRAGGAQLLHLPLPGRRRGRIAEPGLGAAAPSRAALLSGASWRPRARGAGAMLALALLALPAPFAPAVEDRGPLAETPFDSYWHDGKAELDGYRMTIQRYGRPRMGRAVLVYVTEPFSKSKHVKVDDPSKHPEDTF